VEIQTQNYQWSGGREKSNPNAGIYT